MKLLVLAVLLSVACLLAVAGSVSGQPNQATDDKQHHAENRTQAVRVSDHERAAQHTRETDNDPPHWYTPLKRPEWWLVGFGFGAVIVAWRTLNAINRQVATFISKERGRLAVELQPFELRGTNELWQAGLLVTNHGSTKVFIENTGYLPCVEKSKWNTENAAIHLVIVLPKVIAPDQTAPRFDGPVQQGDKLHLHTWDMSQEIIDAIRSGKKYVFALGYIQYGDVFGNTWRLRFSRQWRASFQPDGTIWHGDWSDYGPPEANSECQIKQPSRLVKLWRKFQKGLFPQP
jgi:hypothetical protein